MKAIILRKSTGEPLEGRVTRVVALTPRAGTIDEMSTRLTEEFFESGLTDSAGGLPQAVVVSVPGGCEIGDELTAVSGIYAVVPLVP